MKRAMRKYWLLMVVVCLLALMPMAVWAQEDSVLVTVESTGTAVEEAAGHTNLGTGTDVALPDISANESQQTTVALPQLESDKPTDTVETPDAKIESQAVSGGFEYEAVSGGVSITKYNGYEFEVTIPDTLDGKPVVKIGSGAFDNGHMIFRIIVGNNVKTIESNAFGRYVDELTIPETTTEIAVDAIPTNHLSGVRIYGAKGSAAETFANKLDYARFLNLNMMENDFYYEDVAGGVKITYYDGSESPVIIPDTLGGKPVVVIGSNAVYNLKIMVGNNVKKIESNAFGSSLQELTIPETTTDIAIDAVPANHYDTVNVYGSKGSAAESFAKGLDNARFLNLENEKDGFWYEEIEGGVKIVYYNGNGSIVIIPDMMDGQPVVKIGSGAFTDSNVFSDRSMKLSFSNIIVGNNVKSIESKAFNGYHLKELTIPETTTNIAADAIITSAYNTVKIYGTKGSVAESFAKGLDNVRFLDLEYEENGFWYEEIEDGIKIVYYNGSESALIIPDTLNGKSVVAIGSKALTDCYAASIIVGNNVKTIESKAFNSRVKRLTIPKTTTDIAADTIDQGYSSNTVNIFGSKGSAAESFAKGLNNARFLAWEDRMNNFWVEETEGGIKIIGYDDSEEKVTIPSTLGGVPVVAIGAGAFANCNTLKEVTIPDSVMLLENGDYYGGIFYSCNFLEKLTMGKGISQIPSSMALNCINLKEVVINGNIKTIGSNAFSGCKSLININLPDSLESIGTYAFNRCNNLSSIIIPDKTATIEAGAFIYCEKLTDLTFGSGLTSLDMQAFAYCAGLETVSIPDKIETIGAAAFTYCKKLTSITFGSGLTSLGSGALAWCESLETVSIPEGLTTIDSGGVFMGAPVLSKVEIPKSVTSITSNIFELSPKTNIYGIKGSYAQTYAQEYGIPFVEQGSEPGDDPTDEPGAGELTGFIGQDLDGNYFLYNKTDFNSAYLAYQINPDLAAAKMYQHFLNQKCQIVALKDLTKGYMDYNAAATASLLAQMKGESFNINAYFGRSDAKRYGQTVNNVGNVAKDGSVTY